MTRRRGQGSLFGEILDWMLAPLLLLWPVSVLLTWLVAQGIANRPFDRELAERVRVLSQHVQVRADAGAVPQALLALPPAAEELIGNDPADQIYFQVRDARGGLLGGERALAEPPDDDTGSANAAPGGVRFRDETIANEPVRVAYQRLSVGAAPGVPVLVQVAETLQKRSQLASEIIKGVILPQFVILPLAVLLVWLALARGIAPLNALQRHIRSRESTDLSPIDEHEAPEEVAPLVRAINDLLARLDRSITTQRHFLGDAAHQLKTPLAGLRTQAELAQREIDAGPHDAQRLHQSLKKSLQQIAHSSQRAAHMVNQLLALARAEDKEHGLQLQPLRLEGIATDTVRDFVPRAMEKRIDLGYEGPDAASSASLRVLGQPVLLRELIRNLVDNALHYTPAGGTVTVRIVDDPFGQVVVLQVEDDGPGIPAAERERVFEPFYRMLGTNVDGSGLGLAIVRRIAQQHGAALALEDADDARPATPGARFTLRFPAVPAPPAVLPSSSPSASMPAAASDASPEPAS